MLLSRFLRIANTRRACCHKYESYNFEFAFVIALNLPAGSASLQRSGIVLCEIADVFVESGGCCGLVKDPIEAGMLRDVFEKPPESLFFDV